jgi:hypothetical protein
MMRRHKIRTYGVRPTRLVSMLLTVAVLWMVYGRVCEIRHLTFDSSVWY